MAYIRRPRVPGGAWQAQVRLKGHVYTQSFPTRKLAEAWATRTEASILDGVVETQTDRQRLEATRVRDLIGQPGQTRCQHEVWDDRRAAVRHDPEQLKQLDATIRREQDTLNRILCYVGDQSLARLDVACLKTDYLRVRREQRGRRGQFVSDATIQRELRALSGLLTRARELWGYPLTTNPARELYRQMNSGRLWSETIPRERRLRPGEYRKLLRAARSPKVRHLIRLAIELCLRRSEVARLRPEHLRPDGLWVPFGKRQRRGVVIPISRRARQLIEQLPPEGFGWAPDSISTVWDRTTARAGVEGLTFHDLRHEGVSRLFEKGLSIEEVATISRHRDWGSLKIYTQLNNEKIAEKLG